MTTMGGDSLLEAVREVETLEIMLDFTARGSLGSIPFVTQTNAVTLRDAVREVLAELTASEALVASLRNQLDSVSHSQPCADAGTHIPRSPPTRRELDATDVFEAFEDALTDGTPTLSLQNGRVWIDGEAAFAANIILDALVPAAQAADRAEVYECGRASGLMEARLIVAEAIHDSHPIAQSIADAALDEYTAPPSPGDSDKVPKPVGEDQ